MAVRRNFEASVSDVGALHDIPAPPRVNHMPAAPFVVAVRQSGPTWLRSQTGPTYKEKIS